jgi:hypothetical protein
LDLDSDQAFLGLAFGTAFQEVVVCVVFVVGALAENLDVVCDEALPMSFQISVVVGVVST